MSLTRESRVLILLGVFGLGAVVILMAMAEKYRGMIEGSNVDAVVESAGGAPLLENAADLPKFVGEPGSAEEAFDLLRRYLVVRRTLAESSKTLLNPARPVAETTRERIRELRDLAIRRVGLDGGRYGELRRIHLDWKSGSLKQSSRYRQVFERNGPEVREIEREIHPALDL